MLHSGELLYFIDLNDESSTSLLFFCKILTIHNNLSRSMCIFYFCRIENLLDSHVTRSTTLTMFVRMFVELVYIETYSFYQ